jgi:low temperature requirement protein LtrA
MPWSCYHYGAGASLPVTGKPMRLDEETAPPESEEGRRATFLELFFDVVYVFVLFQVSTRIVDNLGHIRGKAGLDRLFFESGKVLVLLLAMWSIWWATAWTTSRYNPQLLRIQAIVILAIFTSLVMALALPQAFGNYSLPFAIAYVGTQVARPAILATALSGERRRLKLRMMIIFSATGVLWIAGALMDEWPQRASWVLALVLELVASRLGWPVPGMGRSRPEEWTIAGEHLGERYQQFFLIVLGESILGAGLRVSSSGLQTRQLAAFIVSVTITVLVWRIYFYRAGLILSEAITRSPHPGRIGRSTADTHFVMISGVLIASIGYQLTIIDPYSRSTVGWAVIVLGPVLFIAGRARFEYEVFGRVSKSRIVALLVLAAMVPLAIPAPQLATALAVAVVLLGVAVADARRAYGRPPERARPPL